MSTIDLSDNSLFMPPLLRYGLVGVLTNVVIFSGYLALTFFGVEPKIAMTLTYSIGAFIGFLGNRKWTFTHDGNVKSAAFRFVIAHACGYLLNYLILSTFVDKLAYPHQWVQAASIMLVAAFLFVVFKFWVFRKDNVVRQ